MCKITEVTGYQIDGKMYETREQAVYAGLQTVAHQLLKKHPSDLASGLKEYADELVYLLGEHIELAAPRCAVLTMPPDDVEPDPDHTPFRTMKYIKLDIREATNDLSGIARRDLREWMQAELSFNNLDTLLNHGNETDVHRLAEHLQVPIQITN